MKSLVEKFIKFLQSDSHNFQIIKLTYNLSIQIFRVIMTYFNSETIQNLRQSVHLQNLRDRLNDHEHCTLCREYKPRKYDLVKRPTTDILPLLQITATDYKKITKSDPTNEKIYLCSRHKERCLSNYEKSEEVISILKITNPKIAETLESSSTNKFGAPPKFLENPTPKPMTISEFLEFHA